MHWFGRNDAATLEDVVKYLRDCEQTCRFNATHATTKRDQGQHNARANELRAAAAYIEDAIESGPTPERFLKGR
jgi:hypothetical protein